MKEMPEAHEPAKAPTFEHFGNKKKASFHLFIEQCCCWGAVYADVAAIKRELKKEYADEVYLTV